VVKEKEEERGCDRGEEQEEEEEDRSWWSYKLDNGHGEERRRNDDNNTHPGYVTPRTQELWSLDGNKRKGSGLEERGLRGRFAVLFLFLLFFFSFVVQTFLFTFQNLFLFFCFNDLSVIRQFSCFFL
jgi:hypothetical protein